MYMIKGEHTRMWIVDTAYIFYQPIVWLPYSKCLVKYANL